MHTIGIDIVDIEEFRSSIHRTPDILDRIFSAEERGVQAGARTQSLASWFAAKEAFMKALWSRVKVSVEWHDVMLRHGPDGEPILELSPALSSRLAVSEIKHMSVSLSHTKSTAAAVVLLEFP